MQTHQFSEKAFHRIRDELKIPADALVVGHVARYHPVKGHRLMLCAAASLVNRMPGVHFLFCGRGVEAEKEELSSLVPPGLSNNFHLLGLRSDVSALLSAMDVFVSSSFGEGFSNVLGEAMATAVPCVATDVGDSAMIVSDTGVVVPPRDESALAAGIEKLLHIPVSGRRGLGERARSRIVNNYALETIVDRYSSLYEKLLAAEKVV